MVPVSVILPKECIGHEKDSRIVTYCHPRTGRPSKFVLCDKRIYELTVVDGSNPHVKNPGPHQKALNDARCIFYTSGVMLKECQFLVATPVNPIFFVLQLLYENRDRFMTAENIEDRLEERVNNIKAESLKVDRSISTAFLDVPRMSTYEPFLHLVCDVNKLGSSGTVTTYQFDETKIVQYLNKLRDRMVDNEDQLPKPLVKKFVTDLISPVDPNIDPPQERRRDALQQLAMFLISTYLSDDITTLYFKTVDFQEYENYIAKLTAEKEKAEQAQRALSEQVDGLNNSAQGVKRPAPALQQKSKKQKAAPVAPKNNRSIMDMFKVKKTK